jgi:dethiobiotin synthetase
MSGRPQRLVAVVATGTGVGKTWVAADLLAGLRADGCTVAARKPAQSGGPDDGPADAEVLASATGEAPGTVCPPARSYPVAMAPFMAADVLGRPPFVLDDLVRELSWPDGVQVGLVEGAGGVLSPISSDGADNADLVDRLSPDLVLLVADAGLGTLHGVRACLPRLAGHEVVVVLNRFRADDDLHRRNRAWLEAHTANPVAVPGADLRRRVAGPSLRAGGDRT